MRISSLAGKLLFIAGYGILFYILCVYVNENLSKELAKPNLYETHKVWIMRVHLMYVLLAMVGSVVIMEVLTTVVMLLTSVVSRAFRTDDVDNKERISLVPEFNSTHFLGILGGGLASFFLITAAWPMFDWMRYANNLNEFSLLMRISSGLPSLAVVFSACLLVFLYPRSWPFTKATDYLWSGFLAVSLLLGLLFVETRSEPCRLANGDAEVTGELIGNVGDFFAVMTETGLVLTRAEASIKINCEEKI